jgi:hypothetical protein
VVEQGATMARYDRSAKGQDCGTKVEMEAEQCASKSKDDDCAQNNGFTPAALCAYREGRKDG